jgi:hypothetical protein
MSLQSPKNEEGGGVEGPVGDEVEVKRHVVQHDWNGIRDAMHVAKHEHLSGVDVFVSPPRIRMGQGETF